MTFAEHWQQLRFWLSYGIIRGIGYLCFIMCGICIERGDVAWIGGLEYTVGHLLVTAAEAYYRAYKPEIT